MDRDMLCDHLAEAERHVVLGKGLVAKQLALIAELERQGRSTTDATGLLKLFEEVQAIHVADRNRLKKEIETRTEQAVLGK